MRIHPLPVIALSLSLLAAGCQSADDATRARISAPSGSGDMAPAEAAKVCLATARELDRNGYEVEAIDQYERARQLDPSLPKIARRLAVLYDRQGNDSRAVPEYIQALRESPDDAELLNDFGFFHAVRNNGSEAEKWLRQAVAKDPNSQRAWVNFGTALAEQRKYSQSYDAFARVLPPAQARSNLGIIQAQQGDYESARQTLTLAAAADPDLPQPKAALQWIRNQIMTIDLERAESEAYRRHLNKDR